MRLTNPLSYWWDVVIYIDETPPTCQDATSDPGDSLYFCDVVVDEVVITSGIEGVRITEGPPQFGGDSVIVYFDDLCTDVIAFREKSAVSQKADAAKKVNRGIVVTYDI